MPMVNIDLQEVKNFLILQKTGGMKMGILNLYM